MQFLPALALAAVAALDTSAGIKRSDPVLVRYVIDGDTIDVAMVGRVRLLGIDAPEMGRGFDTAAPFGRQARDRLAMLVLHRWVRLEREGSRLDAYGRHLAYVVREDGVFVNAVLVSEGLARISAHVPLSAMAMIVTLALPMWSAQMPPTTQPMKPPIPITANDSTGARAGAFPCRRTSSAINTPSELHMA